MNSEYQAIYDAITLQASGLSWAIDIIKQEICFSASRHASPSVLYRPVLSIDGNQWMALYGENLMNGVAGFGETPEKAMEAFDKAWREESPPRIKERA